MTSGLNAARGAGFLNGLGVGPPASPPAHLAGRTGRGWKAGVALAAAAFLLLPFALAASPSPVSSETQDRADAEPDPAATTPPAWPALWNLLVIDPDVAGVSSKVVDIVEVRAFSSGWDPYLYVRIVTESRAIREEGGIPLAGHSWWVYLDFGDGNNDWIVGERVLGVCSLAWDVAGADWGILPGCDVFDTETDADVGSAVRAMPCYSARDCIDFAIEKSDYPMFGSELILTAAVDSTEDLDLVGDRSRNPRSASVGCDAAYLDDCTFPVRMNLQIPEFPSLLAVAAGVPWVLAAMRRRVAGRARRSQGR